MTTPLSLPRSPAKVLGVFAIFAIGGPLLAVVILIVAILPFYNGHGINFVPNSIQDFNEALARLIVGSYWFGSLQAATIGLAATLWLLVLRKPRVSLLLITLFSLAIGVLFVIVAARPFSMPALDPGIVLSVLILHVAPAVACALIANLLLRPTANDTPAVAP